MVPSCPGSMIKKRTERYSGVLIRQSGTVIHRSFFHLLEKSVDGKYRYEGKEYNISSHGFARDMDFEPVLCDMDECTYVLKDTPGTMEKYPFHFELEITHRLKGRAIETSWKSDQFEWKGNAVYDRWSSGISGSGRKDHL